MGDAEENKNSKDGENENDIADALAKEAAELDGYFSDASLKPEPMYPPLKESFDTAIIITNLPVVPEQKVEKLTKVVLKLVSRVGSLSTLVDDSPAIVMPFDQEKGSTRGFCFVEYQSAEDAKKAFQVLEGWKFDKNHSLSVTPYTRALQLKRLKETQEFEEPEPAPYVEKPNAMAWLEDPNQRDEFVVRQGRETEVFWFDGKNDPVVDYDGSREKEAGVVWCEYYVHWSPQGSYLATLVPNKGVILWSGASYEKSGRFPAPGVKMVIFSPQENYILTNNQRHDDPAAIKIFHIPTGKLCRVFPLFPDNFKPPGSASNNNAGEKENRENVPNAPPPPFLWSHDDKYIARMGNDLISIYETPSMRLLNQRSLDAQGIHEFQWSPKANILAYWAPEDKNAPAHVDLIEIPSRKKLRQKNLFHVTKCHMVWQDQGEYLAVKVTRHTKSRKTLYNNIELFRLNEMKNSGNVPVEMLDISDAVMALAWEPRGSRFAMIHAENPSSTKVHVSFYDMMKKPEVAKAATTAKGAGKGAAAAAKSAAKGAAAKGDGGAPKGGDGQAVPELHKVETLEGRQCNYLFWSPAGQTILLASLGESASGTLEFYNVDTKAIVVKEHYRANQVMWDPSGRSVATVVSQPVEGGHFKFAMDNGYILWSFQGKQLYQQSYEAFYQFVWRPREQLLSKQEMERVRKNLKKYEKQFDKADKERQRALYLEETKGKREERSKYRDMRKRLQAIRKRQKEERMALLRGYDSDDDANYVVRELTVETVVSTKEVVV